MISIVTPELAKARPESVEEVWMIFCHQVHFFKNRQLASEWFARKNFKGIFLSIEDGFELGRLAFRDILQNK